MPVKASIFIICLLSGIFNDANSQKLEFTSLDKISEGYSISQNLPSSDSSLDQVTLIAAGKTGRILQVYADQEGKIQIQLPDTMRFLSEDEGNLPSGVLSHFHEGYAAILERTTGKIGFINTEGEWVIPPQFTRVGVFSEGLAFFADLGTM